MFELIRANKIKSWILILGLTSVLVVLGLIIGEVVAPGGGGVIGVAIAVAIAAFMNLLAYSGPCRTPATACPPGRPPRSPSVRVIKDEIANLGYVYDDIYGDYYFWTPEEEAKRNIQKQAEMSGHGNLYPGSKKK